MSMCKSLKCSSRSRRRPAADAAAGCRCPDAGCSARCAAAPVQAGQRERAAYQAMDGVPVLEMEEVRAPANNVGLVFTLKAEALPQMCAADSRLEDGEFPALRFATVGQFHWASIWPKRSSNQAQCVFALADRQPGGNRVKGRLPDSYVLSFSETTAGSAPEEACGHPPGCWFHAGEPAVGRDG